MLPLMGKTTSDSQRDFFRIVTISTAIGFAGVGGSLASLSSTPRGLIFTFGPGVVFAAVLGAVLGWLYWKLILRLSSADQNGRGNVRKFWYIGGAAVLLGIVAFLYPARFVARENMREVLEGLIMAFAVLAFVAFLFWRAVRFFNEDSQAHPSSPAKQKQD